MSMFDWYQPATQLTCPECGTPLKEWQGKDGPCGLFVWREGVRHPVDQLIDDEEVRLPPGELSRFTLPSSFEIYSYDCPNHQPIDAVCATGDGVWSSTQVQSFRKMRLPRR
jgi:hypothetical protein